MKVNKILTLAIASALIGCSTLNQVETKSSSNTNYKIEPTTTADLIQADNAEQYYQIGKKYQKEGKYDLAIVAFQKALMIENKNNLVLQKNYLLSITGLATAYANKKLYFLAIPLLKEVVEFDPSPASYNNLGYAYYLDAQYEEAHKSLNKALSLDPHYVQASKNLNLITAHLDLNTNGNKTAEIDKNTENLTQESLINKSEQSEAKEEKTIINETVILTLNQTENGMYELGNMVTPQKLEVINPIDNSNIKSDETNKLQALVSGGISFELMPAISQLFDIGNNMLALFTPNNTNKYIEVINGNCLKSIASTVVNKLKEGGTAGNYRVADATKFNKSRTYIQYKSSYEEDAIKLQYSFLNQPALVKNDNLPEDVMIRMVLGRDLITVNKNIEGNT